MYLLPIFHLLLFSVFVIYCQTRNLNNGNSTNKNNTLKTSEIKLKNVTTGSVKEVELKAESSERTYMRDYGTKYDGKQLTFLPSQIFHIDDGIDIQFGHSSSVAESGNNSNGYYGVNKHTTDHSKRTLNKSASKHRRPMPPFDIDFKIPSKIGKRSHTQKNGCQCDCSNYDHPLIHHRSYQQKGDDDERDLKVEEDDDDFERDNEGGHENMRMGDNEESEGDFMSQFEQPMQNDKGGENNYSNYANFNYFAKWKHQTTAGQGGYGNENGSQYELDRTDVDQQQQQQGQQQHQNQQEEDQQQKIGKTADSARIAVSCDFSQSNCNFENDHYDESRFRYGYNVYFKDKLWFIDHFPQRRFPGPADQQRSHGWGRLMTPVYEVPRDAARDACMLIEFEFDSEGTDQLTVILQESDNSRTILDYMHERPGERDSLLLRKYVHFIVTGSTLRFFLQFTFDTTMPTSQYGLRTFELYWSLCPHSKQLTNTLPKLLVKY